MDQIITEILTSINQTINLVYNEPAPAVRVALAEALGHGFAAIANVAKPGRSEHSGSAVYHPPNQVGSAATCYENYSACANTNMWTEEPAMSANRNAHPTRQMPVCENYKHNNLTMPYHRKRHRESALSNNSASRTKKQHHSPKFRQHQSRKRQITKQALDQLNWTELGILEEHRLHNDGTIVSKSALCDQQNTNTERISTQQLEVCETDSTSHETVLHMDLNSELSTNDLTNGVDNETSSCTSELTTILPHDSASNVCNGGSPPKSSALGSLVSTVMTAWNKPKNSKPETCLEAYRNVYTEMRASNAAKTIKTNSFRIETDTFSDIMTAELVKVMNIPQKDVPCKYISYITEKWVVERNTWSTLQDPDQ